MKKSIKTFGSLVVIVLLAIYAKFLHWNRPQQIDFSAILPDKIEHCGKTINQGNTEYIDLLEWFKSNTEGWQNTPATYVPRNTFTSSTLSANVLNDGVIVNYINENGAWSQVQNRKKLNELNDNCEKANQMMKADEK